MSALMPDAETLAAGPGDREAWLALRREGLGGSDAAAALGLHPYRSPLAVWIEKQGWAVDNGQSDAMAWGDRLEPLLRIHVAELTGLQLYPPEALLRSRSWPFMLATPDAIAGRSREAPEAVVEIKVVGARQLHRWAEGPPLEVVLQVLHYQVVTGVHAGLVAALLGGTDFQTFEVAYETDTAALLVEREAEFWELVSAGTPPAARGSDDEHEALRQAFPLNDPTPRELGAAGRRWLRARVVGKADAAEAGRRVKAAEAELEVLLAGSPCGLVDGRIAVERRTSERTGYTVEAGVVTKWWTPKEDEA